MPSGSREPSAADGERQFLCRPCHLLFSTWDAFIEHKCQPRQPDDAKHLHCKFCGDDFATRAAQIQHIKLNHPEDQNLECPGCGQGPFPRVGGLIQHIEGGECTRIDTAVLNDLRDGKLVFARQLEQLTGESVRGNYEKFIATPVTVTDDGHIKTESEEFTLVQDEFPNLSIRTSHGTPDTQAAGSTAAAPAWKNEENLFPNAAPARRPTPGQLQQTTAPSARSMYEAMDIDHPSHRNFNLAKYYSPLNERYNCPKRGCGKTFKKAGGLVTHLKSSAHGDTEYRCPTCLRVFKSLTAITQHAESSSVRCDIRETQGYDVYVDQLTAGLVDVAHQKNTDATVRYETSDTAVRYFRGEDGRAEPKGDTGSRWFSAASAQW